MTECQSVGIFAISVSLNVKELKNHSDTPGSAGILPAFGGRDTRDPRFIIWCGKTGKNTAELRHIAIQIKVH